MEYCVTVLIAVKADNKDEAKEKTELILKEVPPLKHRGYWIGKIEFGNKI